jgi:para-aminobenzoate synthetase component I
MMTKPLCIDIPYQDPIQLFAPHADKPFAQLLDSSMFDKDQGRYSFIALDPFQTFETSNNTFENLKIELAKFPLEKHPEKPPFQGGALGYFSYELLHQIEKIPAKENDLFTTPPVCLGFYDVICAFDHLEQSAMIFSSGYPATEDAREERKLIRAKWLQEMLNGQEVTSRLFQPCRLDWQSDFTAKSYARSVQKVIDYIRAGDIFQANLTQRFSAKLPDSYDSFALYQKLRKANPAPFAAYLNFGNFSIASSSPERFMKLENGSVETRPIKGTRPRKKDQASDHRQIENLRNSEKERAENTMIVDLLRNDISKVCMPHSVNVPELCAVHSFATVHHLVSTITGTLQKDQGAVDLLKACFPGGSITGAPKVRAMEIIEELEPCARGPYCGAIGYIGFDGTMDTNIVIRTLLFIKDHVCAQVGGGIVIESNPEAEYQETLDKAYALFNAFK